MRSRTKPFLSSLAALALCALAWTLALGPLPRALAQQVTATNVQTPTLTLVPSPQIPLVTSATVTPSLGGGGTYCYWLITYDNSGNDSSPAGPWCATNSGAPSAAYPIAINWTPISTGGPWHYIVLRTTDRTQPSGTGNWYLASISGAVYSDTTASPSSISIPAQPNPCKIQATSGGASPAASVISSNCSFPSNGVTSISAVAPIEVNGGTGPATGAIVTSCPNCAQSGGSGTVQNASANLKTASPIETPGTSVVFSPDPQTCNETGLTIPKCSPQRPLIVGHTYLVYYDMEEAGTHTSCAFNDPTNGAGKDSLGNTYVSVGGAAGTDPIVPNSNNIAIFWTTVTTGGADTFTPDQSNCANSGTTTQLMSFVDMQGGAISASATSGYGGDSCGSLATKCAASVTTTASDALLLSMIDISGATGNTGQMTVSPQGTTFSDSVTYPSWLFSATAEAQPGTYSFAATNAGNSSSWTRGAVIAVYPTSPLVGTVVTASANGSSSIGTITYSQTVTAGNRLEVGLAQQVANQNTCTATDSLGNSFSTGLEQSNEGVLFANVTTGGSSDTITLSSGCNNGASYGQVGFVFQTVGEAGGISQMQGSAGSNIGFFSFLPSSDVLQSFIIAATSNNAFTYSSGLTGLASQSSSPSWYVAYVSAAAANASQTYTISGNNNGTFYFGFEIQQSVLSTFPQQPRPTVRSDVGAAAQTYQGSVSGTLTAIGDGPYGATGFDWTLTGNVTTFDILGFTGGRPYSMTFCAGSGGPYSVAEPTNVNVLGWPGGSSALSIAASSCRTYSASYDGGGFELIFASPSTSTNYGILTGGSCSTSASAYTTCTSAVTLNSTEPDTNYSASCTGIGITGFPYIAAISKGTSSITVTISNGASNGAAISSYSEIDCVVVGE